MNHTVDLLDLYYNIKESLVCGPAVFIYVQDSHPWAKMMKRLTKRNSMAINRRHFLLHDSCPNVGPYVLESTPWYNCQHLNTAGLRHEEKQFWKVIVLLMCRIQYCVKKNYRNSTLSIHGEEHCKRPTFVCCRASMDDFVIFLTFHKFSFLEGLYRVCTNFFSAVLRPICRLEDDRQ